MRLVLTGGGTGGHVFPALEVARAAKDRGDEVLYVGSVRGQERKACEKVDVPFVGLPSAPVPRRFSLRAAKAVWNLVRSSQQARSALKEARPDAVFSTGGYSSAPVVAAARKLGIPYVIHEQNTVPGRTNKLFSPAAHAIAVVFKTGHEHFAHPRVVRTGMPIRRELRDSLQGTLGFAQSLPTDTPILLVMGGSQGAAALNDTALATAVRMATTGVQWLHVTGPNGFDATLETKRKLAVQTHYEVRAYLEAEEMAAALFSCAIVVCRSGGSLAEVAAFRKPSISVPLPHAMGNHQYFNALEFEAMGATSILPQRDLAASTLEARIQLWLTERDKYAHAQEALAEWDVPDATERILDLIDAAARCGSRRT